MHPMTIESLFKIEHEARIREADAYRQTHQPKQTVRRSIRHIITRRPTLRLNNDQQIAHHTV